MLQPDLEKVHFDSISRPVNFSIGDVVKVHYKIKEGDKERIQVYEGTVIAINNTGAGKSFTVRRISFDVGVERVFPLYTPMIDKIEKVRSNKVRRAKLYFLRDKIGKHARLKEMKKTPKKDMVYERAVAYQKEKAEKVKPEMVEPVETTPAEA